MSQADNLASLGTNVNTSGVLQPASGGTGAATLTANNVLLGNGTSAVQAVAPGTTGNLLTSNGTTWTSAAPPAGSVGDRGQVFTSSGTFTIPAGVSAIKVTVVGGGGGGQGFSYIGCCTVVIGGASGGTSSVSSGTQAISTVSATGGASSGGAGGAGSGGSLNMNGGRSLAVLANNFVNYLITGGDTILSTSAVGIGNVNVNGTAGNAYGGGGTGAPMSQTTGGGGGGTAIQYLTSLTPGNTLTVTIGTGGAGGVGNQRSGGAGAAGVVIFEF